MSTMCIVRVLNINSVTGAKVTFNMHFQHHNLFLKSSFVKNLYDTILTRALL